MMYKYGPPEGADIKELQKKIDDIFGTMDSILHDPKEMDEIYRSARMTGTLTYEQLHRPFTI